MANTTEGEADIEHTGREPASGEVLVRAVISHQVVEFEYHGHHRIVEPHLVGIHQAGEAMLLAYQTGGTSRSGELPGWRTFIVAEIHGVGLEGRRFPGPRPDFVHSAEGMTEVFARA
ncbi:MAG: hypothetical protein ACR2HK_01475 [Gemmatimonadales bacterium]